MGLTSQLALLRGINVGGANKISMPDLRAVFEDIGYENVRTYLQSGNVVFESRSSEGLAAELEAAVSRTFGLSISIMIRTRRELERVAGANPFVTTDAKPTSLHVMFLSERPAPKAVNTLDANRSPPDEFEVKGREVFLWYPNGSGRSKLTIDYVEKRLGIRATARNWNTITKVLDLME